jgi:hypothetical protein
MNILNFLSPARQLPMIALLFMATLSACNKDEDPGVRPEVLSTGPLANATGVALNSSVSAVFSVNMNANAASKLTLKHGTDNVAGASVLSGATVTFTPTAMLLPTTLYTASISKSVANSDGTTMLQDFSWNFTTGAAPDVTKPTVTLSSPLNNAIGVAVNGKVVITFSEAMDVSTFTADNFSMKQGTTAVAGAITSTGTTLTFTPSANLDSEKIYIATLTTGVKDAAGNAIAANHLVTFTTADAVAPLVSARMPLADATNVARNQILTITFNENMDASTITSASFTVKEGNNSVAGTVSYALKTATFTPTNIFGSGLLYTATVTTAAKDLAGNALASNSTWKFTTSDNVSSLAVVNLGEAGNYVILAKTAINNSSTTAITGDLGLSPAATSYITGFALTDFTGYATSSQITGKVYAADMASPTPVNLTTAVENMITAYNDAAGRPSPDFLELATGNIGGRTLTPGLYKWTSTVSMPTDVVISGGANDVWIFQISGDLSMSSAVNMTLIGGAQAKNIFWQVAGQATIETTAHFEGIILSMTGITFQTGASLNGRALAQTAVILDSNAVTKPN